MAVELRRALKLVCRAGRGAEVVLVICFAVTNEQKQLLKTTDVYCLRFLVRGIQVLA